MVAETGANKLTESQSLVTGTMNSTATIIQFTEGSDRDVVVYPLRKFLMIAAGLQSFFAMTISRKNLSGDVIYFVHETGRSAWTA